jgi:uncharacterized protein (TIGR03085 family)
MSAADLAARERAELCDLMLKLGPDAPTLDEGWTVVDLAAHLVAREHDVWAAPGLVWGGAFAAAMEAARRRRRRRGLDKLVEAIRKGPPLWWKPVPRGLQLNEFYIHHEDVRRANGLGPRTDRPDLDRTLTRLVRNTAPAFLRHVAAGVELVVDGETIHTHGPAPRAVLSGPPGDLVLYLTGRRSAAQVSLGGDPEAARALAEAGLSI